MPDLDERLEHLMRGLTSPVETTGAVERVRGRMIRRRRQRRLVAGGGLVAVAAATLAVTLVVSSSESDRQRVRVVGPVTTTTAAPPSTTVLAPDRSATALAEATAAWATFRQTRPAGTVASDVTLSAEGPVAVTGGDAAELTLYRFGAGAWRELQRFETVLPLAPAYGLAGHVVVADVTGDRQSDFVALDFPGADHVGGSVLSAHGGRWHLVAFGDSTYVTFLSLEDAEARARYGSVLETRENDCTPDCADGTVYENHWRFDAGTGSFVSVDRRVAPR